MIFDLISNPINSFVIVFSLDSSRNTRFCSLVHSVCAVKFSDDIFYSEHEKFSNLAVSDCFNIDLTVYLISLKLCKTENDDSTADPMWPASSFHSFASISLDRCPFNINVVVEKLTLQLSPCSHGSGTT